MMTDAVYELYEWWSHIFNFKDRDNKRVKEWLQSQIKCDNGVLQINTLEDEE